MDSDLLSPFEIDELEPYDYVFVNRDGIRYRTFFSPLSEYYPQFVDTYSFSIEPEDRSPHPVDMRIAATIVEILKLFFRKNENAMIMVCDNLDGKEEKRRKLFDRWFIKYSDGTIDKYDAASHSGDYNLFASIYMRDTNPNKGQLVNAFYDLMKSDIYDIVI